MREPLYLRYGNYKPYDFINFTKFMGEVNFFYFSAIIRVYMLQCRELMSYGKTVNENIVTN